MIKYTFKRFLREPIPRFAVLLFAAVMALLLCVLQISMERELKSRQFIYDTVPVPVYITNLTGTQKDNLGISSSTIYAFESGLDDYITDISLKNRVGASWVTVNGEILPQQELVGITSPNAALEFVSYGEDAIIWNVGCDQAMLRQNNPVCILPQSFLSGQEEVPETVQMHFEATIYNAETMQDEMISFDIEFSVIGYHIFESRIYCPAATVDAVLRRLYIPVKYDFANGILINNHDVGALREAANEWFAEPSLMSEMSSDKYSYALKIDDSQLRTADEAMEQSERINRICAVVIFVMVAAAGFLIGFLAVRNRKKEIALMRTMGTPNQSIYFGFALEQMLCVVLGIMLGGSYNGWHPSDRLGILAAIHFVGLTVALLIFLRKSLLTTIKEDE